jgi:hypothetical protein
MCWRDSRISRDVSQQANVPRMSTGYGRIFRAVPLGLSVLTLMSIGVLLACDAIPHLVPVEAHGRLAALPLVLIAVAHIAYQAVRRASMMEWAKAILLALAFLFWAANQLWSDRSVAVLFNDVAIAAFVLDVFLVMVGWPGPAAPEPTAKRAPNGSLCMQGKEPLGGATN